MKKYLLLTCLTLLLGAAVNITGKWSGTIAVQDEGSGATITTPVHVQFEQQSTALSGKIGRVEENDVIPISNAKLDGNTVYFEAASPDTEGPMKFVLTLTGDRLEGNMHGSTESADITGKVKLAREK
ncbi:MAG: hypothetical protein M3Y07_00260 [Acidobacteriota bacterium]|nr:hypothetical protein [Acidobacteriota bacterium]